MANSSNELAIEFLRSWYSTEKYISAHTSGSTGKPKEIKLLKSDMIASAKATCDFFRICKNDVIYCPLSLNYIAGKMMAVRGEVSGAKVIYEVPSNNILTHYSGPQIKLLAVVPSQLQSVIDNGADRYVENIIIGGSPLDVDMEEKLIGLGINAFVTFGMTETCSHVALRRVGQKSYHSLPGYSFATDDRGCLVINTRLQSFERIVTNDIVNCISETEFFWMGRYDNVINSGGIKLHPEIIERDISAVIKDRAFYLTSRPDAKWGQEAVLVVEGHPDNSLLGIVKQCGGNLSYIRDIVFVAELPRTSNGKLKRVSADKLVE